MAKALEGAKPGDVRVWSEDATHVWAMSVRERVAPKRQAFAEVKSALGRRAFGEKLKASLDDWTKKLRAATKVEVFASPAQLPDLVENKSVSGA